MPKFRQRLIVDAVQWWPPGSPLHDSAGTPVAAPADPVRLPSSVKPGTIFPHDSKTGFYLVLNTGLVHPLMPGEWIFPKVNQVWSNNAFEASYEHVPEVPTPKTPEDEHREYVLLEKGLEEPAARLLRALYVTGAILPAHTAHVRKWLETHGILNPGDNSTPYAQTGQ